MLTLLAKFLLARASKSVSAYLSGALVTAGVAAAAHPELLELIPVSYRGYAIMAWGALTLAARFRREFSDEVSKLKGN